MESGIYHKHETSIVMGGRVGLVAGKNSDGQYFLLIGELDKEYESGEPISDSETKKLIKNAEVCIFFQKAKDVAVLRNVLYETEQQLAFEEQQSEQKKQDNG